VIWEGVYIPIYPRRYAPEGHRTSATSCRKWLSADR